MDTAIKILKDAENGDWGYDEEADVLYFSVGEPRVAEGVDIGDGVVVRFDGERNEVVGVTMIGIRARVLKELQSRD